MGWNISKKRKTKKITNGDDYILLEAMNQGDRDELEDLLMKMDVSNAKKQEIKEEATQSARLMLGSMRHFQRVRCIKDWNLKYDDGSAIPLNEESIRNLPPEVVTEIDEAIEEINPDPLGDSKKKK